MYKRVLLSLIGKGQPFKWPLSRFIYGCNDNPFNPSASNSPGRLVPRIDPPAFALVNSLVKVILSGPITIQLI